MEDPIYLIIDLRSVDEKNPLDFVHISLKGKSYVIKANEFFGILHSRGRPPTSDEKELAVKVLEEDKDYVDIKEGISKKYDA